jgi:regulatory protein
MSESAISKSSEESEVTLVVMRRLNSAPRSRGELAKYLLARDFDPETIELVLDRVAAMGYIDDAEYAQEWVRSRHRSRGLAPSVIKRELIAKNIDIEQIDTALEQITSADLDQRAYELAAKKYRSLHSVDPSVAIRRIASQLQRKGYPPGLCFRIAKDTVGADLDSVGDLGD